MKKLSSFLFSFLLLFTASFHASSAYAATAGAVAPACKLEITPAKVTTDTKTINLIISGPGLEEGKAYTVRFGGVFTGNELTGRPVVGGKITLNNVNSYGVLDDSSLAPTTYKDGVYSIEVADQSGVFGRALLGNSAWITQSVKCKATFSVEKSEGTKCSMYFPSGDIKTNQDIKMRLLGFGDPTKSYITAVQKEKEGGTPVLNVCHTAAEYAQDGGVSLGTLKENGIYFVSVYPVPYVPGVGQQCSVDVNKMITLIRIINPFLGSLASGAVTAASSTNEAKSCSGFIQMPGLAIGIGTADAATLSGFLAFNGAIPSPCQETKDSTSINPHYICQTALGPIDTNASAFAKQLFGILLSLSGGIALLLIINAGYQIMTSEGNPEKLQAARETITSAIIGLVFIIFSLVILQIIGVDILRIPGLSK